MDKPLAGQVAVVTGATRGAGRGIAAELAAAGATVWCVGRSVRGAPATPGRPETLEETAEMIAAAGGSAVVARADCTIEAEVEAVAARVRAEAGRLDVLVNDIWGGDELIDWGAKFFWTQDIAKVRAVVDQAVFSHLIAARHLAPLMVEARRGLIVEVTDGHLSGYRGQILHDFAKMAVIRLAYAMAWDLAGTGVTALAISPGFLRSEAMLERFGVTEANWRDAARDDAEFIHSETPRYIGRAIAALAGDPNVKAKSGVALWGADVAREYGVTDVDGGQPDFWGAVMTGLRKTLEGDGELDRHTRFIAASRYQTSHLTPALAEEAGVIAGRLGWKDLPAGLRPIS